MSDVCLVGRGTRDEGRYGEGGRWTDGSLSSERTATAPPQPRSCPRVSVVCCLMCTTAEWYHRIGAVDCASQTASDLAAAANCCPSGAGNELDLPYQSGTAIAVATEGIGGTVHFDNNVAVIKLGITFTRTIRIHCPTSLSTEEYDTLNQHAPRAASGIKRQERKGSPPHFGHV